MKDANQWIKYLKSPMVLAGFSILAVVGLVKALFVDNITEWIGHLQNSIVLLGFALFIIVSFLKPLLAHSDKLAAPATEHLLHKALNLLFFLAFFIVLAGFILSLKQNIVNDIDNSYILVFVLDFFIILIGFILVSQKNIVSDTDNASIPSSPINHSDIGTKNSIKSDLNIYHGMRTD